MDALDPEDDEWRNRRPTPGPTSLMTISPDLTLHGREEAMEFLERKMEPEERCNPGSSGDVADDTLHDHDVNAGPSAANPTACVSWFDLSSPSSVPNEKKISSALPFLQIITTSRIGLESTVVNSTLSNPSWHDNSTHLASSLGLSLGGGFTFGSASTISKKTNSSILSRHAISSSIPPSRSYVQDISVETPIHAQSLSSYDLIGTLGQGTSGKVFLASLKRDPGGGLHALKTIWKDDISSCSTQDTVDELSTLRLIAGALRLGDLSVPFLQILIEDSEDDNFLYLALVCFTARASYKFGLNVLIARNTTPPHYPPRKPLLGSASTEKPAPHSPFLSHCLRRLQITHLPQPRLIRWSLPCVF
jgi:hypothetical protein